MFARGFGEAPPGGIVSTLPQLNLSQSLEEQQDTPFRELAGEISPAERAESSHVIDTPDGPVWLSGNVVMCCCPECEAPVSVRLWLMLADCWNCQTAIELGYEQQLAAMELAERVSPAQTATPPRSVAGPATATDDDEAAIESIEEIEITDSRERLVDILRKSVGMMPAWLVSLLVHVVLLLILALILLPQSTEFDTITVSTAVAPEDIEGGIDFDVPLDDPLEFDSPLPPEFEEIQRELRQVRIAADQDARELLIDPDPMIELPDLEEVVESVTTRVGPASTLATRDPRLRNEIVEREGGTTLTEAAVSRGLRWLASVQNQDGSWSLADYMQHDDPDNRGDAAGTSLALLPFLGAGQTHESGKYKTTVAAGLKWLIEHQRANGDLRYGILSEAGMYAHGQASIVLVEALAMTGDERFREPAQKAIDFIEAAQHKNGGWRYKPGQSGDTSVLGWQLMALQSARASGTGLRVEDSTLRLADYYLDLASRSYQQRRYRNVPTGSLYRYLPSDGRPRATMTAEALLCRMYLGWKRDDPRLRFAIRWLLENALPDRDEKNIYYYYYATQVMHHYGGSAWETWNSHVRDMLVVEQSRRGRYAGSWNPKEFEWGRAGGRIYVTAMAVCTLEVYYRHLPLFKKLDLE
ncbi:MAG: prenyltransferase/squalene oxidase repeat-containing protein [Pirellulaceae bacterium]